MNWQERNELVISAGEAFSDVQSLWERHVRIREYIASRLTSQDLKTDARTIQSLTREASRISALANWDKKSTGASMSHTPDSRN